MQDSWKWKTTEFCKKAHEMITLEDKTLLGGIYEL